MRRTSILGIALVAAFVFSFSPGAADQSRGQGPVQARPLHPPDNFLDEAARFISGLPCSWESLKSLQESLEWKNFSEVLDKNWAELDAKRLQPMKSWAATEMAEAAAATKILFYPFGGPDFLTAFLLFPNACVYLLLGLEFVGKLPDFTMATPQRVGNYMADLLAGLSDFFNKSYFITKNMDSILSDDKVDGVLPILCFFLERTGHKITRIVRCEFSAQGEIKEVDFTVLKKRPRRPNGIRIDFVPRGSGGIRSVYYFSCDLADAVFSKDSSLYRFLNNFAFETTFVKSASYLMHYREFSNIRNLVLAKSQFVLEDDTGIPYRYFPAKQWEAQLYGQYSNPVSDFTGVEQKDLKEAYADPAKVKKLPFHLGYHWGSSKDSILYFKKKTVAASR